MRRIDRYMITEMSVPAFIGGVFVLMLGTGNVLFMLLRWLYRGAPAAEVFQVLLYRLPSVLLLVVPAALLLGTSLAINRLERDQELIAMRLAGIRLQRLMLPFIFVGLLASVGLFYLEEKVVPPAAHKAEALTRKLLWGTPTAFIPEDSVFKLGDYHVYVRHVDLQARILYDAIFWTKEQGQVVLVTIPVAENRGDLWYFKKNPITKEQPRIYYFINGSRDINSFDVEGVDNYLNLRANRDLFDTLYNQPSTPDELTYSEINSLEKGFRGEGFGLTSLSFTPGMLLFYKHRKLSAPLAALVGLLIAIPLSVRFGRSGGYVGLLLSVVLAFVFVISQQWAQVLTEKDIINPIFGAWAPDALFGMLGTIMLLFEK